MQRYVGYQCGVKFVSKMLVPIWLEVQCAVTSADFVRFGRNKRGQGINHGNATQARSYKHEIIQACISGGDVWRIGEYLT